MGIKRIGKHLLLSRWRVRRVFSSRSLADIEKAIKASEAAHTGQVCVAIEGALDGVPLFNDQSPRARAVDVFSRLRVWDTEHNNGVLIYLLLADRDVEIVADRGLNGKVSDAQWKAICSDMESEFRASKFESGLSAGIAAVTELLAAHFPPSGRHSNELPDKPVVL
jgi:uncharacterized membrane protein YgcG